LIAAFFDFLFVNDLFFIVDLLRMNFKKECLVIWLKKAIQN